jgi:hypothetical protein
MELVYKPAGHVAVILRKEVLRISVNPSPLATNTRGATTRKDQAQAADNGESKKVDKGKGILIELKKPKKVVYPVQIGGVFKIHEWRAPTTPASPVVPPVKKSPLVEKKKVEVPSKVVRALKLIDEEDESEAEKPVKAIPESTPWSRSLLRSRTSR